MSDRTQPVERARIGPFLVNFRIGELRKNCSRLKIHDQPLEILQMLVSRPGELVTREEIRQRLWPSGTYVDFDNGLNSAVNRLRTVLGDSAESPKFIETIPRRGYRFIAPVEGLEAAPVTALAEQTVPEEVAGAKGLDHRRWVWAGTVAFAVFVVAAAVAFVGFRYFKSRPKTALNFQARDWVLITNFENRTGEPVFDGTLEYALERELSNSQFVNVVSRERINDTLRLMRRPLDSKIDAPVGREICLRDGGIRILLTGRVEKLGTTFVLSAELVDPVRDLTVTSITEEDTADSRMAATVRRLSNRVRDALGESRDLIRQSNTQLERVTTPSLHALQLYTQANDLIRSGKSSAASQLLEQAVTEDPGFASGHLLLAYAYGNTGLKAKADPEFQRALALADSASDRERLFILASYSGSKNNDPEAMETYEALLRLYPHHYWATSNLIGLYEQMGRFDDADKLIVHFADLNPGNLANNADAVQVKGILEQDWNGAQPYLYRAKALLAQEGADADPSYATFIKLLPVYQDWLQGNVQHAHDELVRLDQTSPGLDPVFVGSFYDMFGCLKEEAEHYRTSRYQKLAYDALGLIEFQRGNWSEVKTHLRRLRDWGYPAVGSSDSMLMPRVGMRSDVERMLKRGGSAPGYQITAGELALDEGHTAKGVALLETGLKERAASPINSFFLGSESLAGTYEREGRFDDALRILLQASAEKPRIFGTMPEFWMRNELQLADLYRTMGRISDAERVEGGLRKILIDADPDHPILLALQNRPHKAALDGSGPPDRHHTLSVTRPPRTGSE